MICKNCGAEQDEGDLGICVSCEIELCVDCSQYGMSSTQQEGWLCEDCFDEDATEQANL
jgi:hypothetical protein